MAVETPSGTVDGANATFTAASTITAEHQLFVDRVIQIVDVDYTYTGATITFLAGAIPQTGSYVRLYNSGSGLPLAGTGGVQTFDNAANIINDAALELGLVASAVTDPYASTDGNYIQLCALLKSLGQELLEQHQWTQLVKEYTFATTSGDNSYDLPTDFRSVVDQSEWDRTSQWPLGGPLSPQDWQLLQARTVTASVRTWFRVANGELLLYPTPSSAATVALEYMSAWWASTSSETSPSKAYPTVYTDLVYFPRLLMVQGLKWKFKRQKGFDSTAEQQDFMDTLGRAKGKDSPAPVLSLDGRRNTSFRYIDGWNVPDTGFGN